MGGDAPEHRSGICLKLQHVTTDRGVEQSREYRRRGVALQKRDVRKSAFLRTGAGDRQRHTRLIKANDFAGPADQLCGEERDIACTATDVEYTHPIDNSGLEQEPARDRVDQPRLLFKSGELALRMTEHVGRETMLSRVL